MDGDIDCSCFFNFESGNFMKKLRKSFQDKLADAGTVAEECISSIRTVRAFNGEKKVIDDYNGEIMKSYSIAKRLAFGTGTATFSRLFFLVMPGLNVESVCLCLENAISQYTLTRMKICLTSLSGFSVGFKIISDLWLV